jgi:hypothetical protein
MRHGALTTVMGMALGRHLIRFTFTGGIMLITLGIVIGGLVILALGFVAGYLVGIRKGLRIGAQDAFKVAGMLTSKEDIQRQRQGQPARKPRITRN